MKKNRKKITLIDLQKKKQMGEKITALTAYDYSMATLLDQCEMDLVLVGDSLSNVFAGHKTTLPITLEQMIYHASAVVRACHYACVVVDMPFGTYKGDPIMALNNATRIIKESGADAVKLEGGRVIKDSVELIQKAGIPVVGHLGLTPQSILQLGSFSLQASTEKEQKNLLDELKMLEEAGASAVVLEKIPAAFAKEATLSVEIPTIGIGAGKETDGQILVLNDFLGLTEDFSPKFLRKYLHLNQSIKKAVKRYISDVKNEDFPNSEESY